VTSPEHDPRFRNRGFAWLSGVKRVARLPETTPPAQPVPDPEPVPGSLPAVAPAEPDVPVLSEVGDVDQVKLANSRSNNATPEVAPTSRVTHSPFKWGFFGGIGVLLAFVLYQSLDTLRGTLVVLAIAALLAIGLDPAVGILIRRGIRRGFAVLIVMLVLLAFITGAMFAVIPPIVEQVAQFVTDLPRRLESLVQNGTIRTLDERFGLIDRLKQTLSSTDPNAVVSAGFTVAGVIIDLVIVIILTLYFLAGFPKIKRAAYKLAPATKRLRVAELGEKILRQMGSYLGGATLIALLAGVVAGVFAAIADIPYPFAIALGAALLDFIPVVGPIVVGICMLLLGFTVSPVKGLVAGLFYLVYHLIEAYYLYPKVMQRSMAISTASVVVAVVIGGALLGVTGALMAVPITAAIQLIVREVVYPMQDEA
jgi:predicted PurR-regulated permease PerM